MEEAGVVGETRSESGLGVNRRRGRRVGVIVVPLDSATSSPYPPHHQDWKSPRIRLVEKMSLKRKRSVTSVSPSSCASTTSWITTSSCENSPIAFYPIHQSTDQSHRIDGSLQTKKRPYPQESSEDLHSRTQKRWRSNRPKEEEVFGTRLVNSDERLRY